MSGEPIDLESLGRALALIWRGEYPKEMDEEARDPLDLLGTIFVDADVRRADGLLRFKPRGLPIPDWISADVARALASLPLPKPPNLDGEIMGEIESDRAVAEVWPLAQFDGSALLETMKRIAEMRCASAETSADWDCAGAGLPAVKWCASCLARDVLIFRKRLEVEIAHELAKPSEPEGAEPVDDSQLWRGWISGAEENDRAELEAMGIKLGRYDVRDKTFHDCELREKAMDKLAPLWGRFIWGFDEVEG